MARNSEKKSLSKNLLQMKFMQRSTLNADKAEETEQFVAIDDEHWIIANPNITASSISRNSKFDCTSSYLSCMDFGFGRMSFKGFNPEIERLAKEAEEYYKNESKSIEKRQRSEDDDGEIEVSNEDMAERYLNVKETIARKFQKKKKKRTVSDD